MKETSQLSCIAADGTRVKASDFVYRSKLKLNKEEEIRIKNLPLIKHETISDIDDGSKYEWVQFGTDKYGRSMYCKKTGIRRSQTMGEFYGGGVVD